MNLVSNYNYIMCYLHLRLMYTLDHDETIAERKAEATISQMENERRKSN